MVVWYTGTVKKKRKKRGKKREERKKKEKKKKKGKKKKEWEKTRGKKNFSIEWLFVSIVKSKKNLPY